MHAHRSPASTSTKQGPASGRAVCDRFDIFSFTFELIDNSVETSGNRESPSSNSPLGSTTVGRYTHWVLTAPLSADTFVLSVDDVSFFARLERVAEQIGQTDVLRPEIEEFRRRIEEYERRRATQEQAGNGSPR